MIKTLLLAAFVFLVGSIGARSEIVWGVNGHPFTAYPGIPYPAQIDTALDMGARSYRVNISSLGHFDAFQSLLDVAEQKGIAILPVLTPEDLDFTNDSADVLRRKAFKFAVRVGRQFADRIDAWELGNELENIAIIQPCEERDDGTKYPCDFGPAGGADPLDYFGPRWEKVSAALDGLSRGIKSVDPTARRAVGTAGWGHVGAFARMADDEIEWDISVWHSFGEDSEWAFKILADYGRPIWVTELSNAYGSRDGEDVQAKGLTTEMLRLADLAPKYNVEAVFIYELFDEPYWAPSFEAEMGLVRLIGDGAGGWKIGPPKKAYEVARTVIGEIVEGGPRRCWSASIPVGADKPAAAVVRAAYCVALRRDADGAGLQSWSETLEGGADVGDVLRSMISSDEFASNNNVSAMSDEEYVRLIYSVLLDREVDDKALAGEVARMKDGVLTRDQLVLELVKSGEFKKRWPLLDAKVAASSAPM